MSALARHVIRYAPAVLVGVLAGRSGLSVAHVELWFWVISLVLLMEIRQHEEVQRAMLANREAKP